MRGFLLDCNHLTAFCRQDPAITDKLKTFPVEWWVFASAITLGEVEAGHQMTVTTDQTKRDGFAKCIREWFAGNALEITKTTRFYYADIMGAIWRNHPPPKSKTDTEKYLIEQGVQINDVWFVASAWEHKIVAVTTDDMKWIKEAVNGHVQFDNWLEKPVNPLIKFMST